MIEVAKQTALVEAEPITGRTHQIRIHLASAGVPVVGDPLYGRTGAAVGSHPSRDATPSLALRAVALAYFDPFQKRAVRIQAPVEQFCAQFGFASPPVFPTDDPTQSLPPES